MKLLKNIKPTNTTVAVPVESNAIPISVKPFVVFQDVHKETSDLICQKASKIIDMSMLPVSMEYINSVDNATFNHYPTGLKCAYMNNLNENFIMLTESIYAHVRMCASDFVLNRIIAEYRDILSFSDNEDLSKFIDRITGNVGWAVPHLDASIHMVYNYLDIPKTEDDYRLRLFDKAMVIYNYGCSQEGGSVISLLLMNAIDAECVNAIRCAYMNIMDNINSHLYPTDGNTLRVPYNMSSKVMDILTNGFAHVHDSLINGFKYAILMANDAFNTIDYSNVDKTDIYKFRGGRYLCDY